MRPGPSGFGSIASVEFAVTLRAFEEYLPSAPATVLDIGGGPGRYAIELARRGYHLTLADISTGELALAAEKTAEAGARLEDVVQADARELNGFADDAFDAVLLMGPLYHLLEDADRRRAVDEAVRVARPGGMLFATNITRYAALRFWAKREPMRVVEDRLRYEAQIATGKMPDAVGFTDIYLMAPRRAGGALRRRRCGTHRHRGMRGYREHDPRAPKRAGGRALGLLGGSELPIPTRTGWPSTSCGWAVRADQLLDSGAPAVA